MKTYKVKYGQNLFDVAVTLYGSVEGVYGLLIVNPNLGLSTELEEGDEILYQEDWIINQSIVSYFANHNKYPANGECRKMVIEESAEAPFMMAILADNCTRFYMDVEGDGELQVDWGDGKSTQTYQLFSGITPISHWYSKISQRRIAIFYGNPNINVVRIKAGEGELRLLKSMKLQQYENLSGLKDSQAMELIIVNQRNGKNVI